jgi:hypothetical protein
MRSLAVLLAAACLLARLPAALADDRPVTDEERSKLAAALEAEGCSGGWMEYDDDGYYEVDDAKCNDGREYDLTFDNSFKLIEKDADD